MRRTWATFEIVLGLALIAATIWFTIAGIKHPTTSLSIIIALMSAIGVPVGIISISSGYRLLQTPNSAMLRTEAEAMHRAAEALDKAATAQKSQAALRKAASELNAYVAIRSWRLEIERRRQELSTAAEAALQMLRELNDRESLLGVEITQLSPDTMKILDRILARPKYVLPEIRVRGVPYGKILEGLLNETSDSLERQRIRRMTRLAPAILPGEQAEGDESTANSDQP